MGALGPLNNQQNKMMGGMGRGIGMGVGVGNNSLQQQQQFAAAMRQ